MKFTPAQASTAATIRRKTEELRALNAKHQCIVQAENASIGRLKEELAESVGGRWDADNLMVGKECIIALTVPNPAPVLA